jgi:glucokinase
MGNKPDRSEINMTDGILALDFGGTKLAAAVVDLAAEKIVGPVIRKRTPVSEGAKGTMDAMIQCGREALAVFNRPEVVKAVGISFGGPVSEDRCSVLRSNHVADWNGAPLVADISQAFHLPASMDNDGNVAALGEWWFGGYRSLENIAYVQISTGIGGGLIFGRQLYRGSGLAGEFGHYIVEVNGPQCSCGRRGCLESICSGWAIARDGRGALALGSGNSPVLYQLSKNRAETVTAEMVFEACREGDPACKTIVKNALNSLAIMVVNLITCIDPQVIVLGGGLTRSRDIFEKYFLPVVKKQMHPFFNGRCRVELSTLDGNELLLGAALLTQKKSSGK